MGREGSSVEVVSSVVARSRSKTGTNVMSKVKKGITGFLSELKDELLTDRSDDGPWTSGLFSALTCFTSTDCPDEEKQQRLNARAVP